MTHRRDPPIWVQIPVLPYLKGGQMKKKINTKTAFSLIVLLVGIIFYIGWSVTFDKWTDVGVYALSIVLIAFGGLGIILSLLPNEKR